MIRSLLLSMFLASPALADCMQGYLRCTGDVNSYYDTVDPVSSFDCSRFHVAANGNFDHVQGIANAQSMSVPGNTAMAQIYDVFVLTGPPAGTQTTITAVGDFELQNVRQANAATWSSGGLFTPLLAGGLTPNAIDYPFTASAPGTETITHRIELPIKVKAGQGFELALIAGAYSAGNAGGYSHGRLSFTGLPPGSSITSCKGFRQDQPTPALAASWGALKSIYR